jgi:hypothetical protein
LQELNNLFMKDWFMSWFNDGWNISYIGLDICNQVTYLLMQISVGPNSDTNTYNSIYPHVSQ